MVFSSMEFNLKCRLIYISVSGSGSSLGKATFFVSSFFFFFLLFFFCPPFFFSLFFPLFFFPKNDVKA